MKAGVTLFFFSFSMALSTMIIKKWILPLHKPSMKKSCSAPDNQEEEVSAAKIGFWIGFLETLIIFSFVYAGEYGALAIIMGAKEYVRKEKIAENASYYLLGTLINLAIAVLLAQLALLVMMQFHQTAEIVQIRVIR